MNVVALQPRCDCGKVTHRSVKAAREQIRSMQVASRDHPEEGVPVAYRCRQSPGIWHVGHRRREDIAKSKGWAA